MTQSFTLRRYDIKSTKEDCAWAIVVIDTKDGYFSTVSDWGNFAYIWSAPGMEFRKFLCGLNPDYFWGKITHGRAADVFDEEATEKNIKTRLWEMMGEGTIDKRQHDDALEELEGCTENEHTIMGWANALTFDFDYYEGILARRPEHHSWGFATTMLPRIQAVLRAELDLEDAQTGDYTHVLRHGMTLCGRGPTSPKGVGSWVGFSDKELHDRLTCKVCIARLPDFLREAT